MRIGFSFRTACALALAVTIFGHTAPSHARAVGRQTADNLFLTVADAQRGAGLFGSRCSICHTVQAGGPNKVGPNLHALFGRHAGTLPGYNYSPAMRGAAIVWGVQTLDEYIADPHKNIPGDKMPFPGLPNKADRDDLIGYLQQATQ
jgi:cytochrome c